MLEESDYSQQGQEYLDLCNTAKKDIDLAYGGLNKSYKKIIRFGQSPFSVIQLKQYYVLMDEIKTSCNKINKLIDNISELVEK
jgi:hypothetical protein